MKERAWRERATCVDKGSVRGRAGTPLPGAQELRLKVLMLLLLKLNGGSDFLHIILRHRVERQRALLLHQRC